MIPSTQPKKVIIAHMEADKARHDTTNQNNTGAAEIMSDLLLTSCKAIKVNVFVGSLISETLALVSLLVIYHFSMRFTRDFLRLAPVCREGGVPRVLLRFLQHKKLLKELEKNLKT